jgi:WD40 repeat protein
MQTKETPLQAYRGEILTLAFSPEGKRLAASTAQNFPHGAVTVWDPTTGAQVVTLDSHKDLVFAIAFSPRGNFMATASFEGGLKLWDTASWKETASWSVPAGVNRLHFTKDGDQILLNGDGVEVREVKGGKEVRKFSCDASGGFSLSPDEKELVAAGRDTLRYWDYATGKELATVTAHWMKDREGIFDVAHSPDGSRLVSIGVDRTIRLWDTATRKELASVGGLLYPAKQVAFSPDGSVVAVAAGTGHPGPETEQPGAVYLWRMNGKTPFEDQVELEPHEFGVVTLSFSPDSRLLATGSISQKGRIVILDVAKEFKAKGAD